MASFAGFTQMAMVPAAGDARLTACAPAYAWPATAALAAAGMPTSGAKGLVGKSISTFVDSPDTDHRQRRPWGTS
jgi:hypothetical protein